jgi:hypothetical protein
MVPDRSAGSASSPHSTADRCPFTVVLVGDHAVGVALADVRGDAIALVTHDDRQMHGVEAPRRGDRVAEQGATPDGVQHLGEVGLHPGAFACGQNDDGGRP